MQLSASRTCNGDCNRFAFVANDPFNEPAAFLGIPCRTVIIFQTLQIFFGSSPRFKVDLCSIYLTDIASLGVFPACRFLCGQLELIELLLEFCFLPFKFSILLFEFFYEQILLCIAGSGNQEDVIPVFFREGAFRGFGINLGQDSLRLSVGCDVEMLGVKIEVALLTVVLEKILLAVIASVWEESLYGVDLDF